MRTLEPKEREELERLYRPPSGISALDWLKKAHMQQLDICRELEEIADSLPLEVDKEKCLHAAKTLGPLIKSVHHFEENVLYPWVAEHGAGRSELMTTLERLKFEHCEDECFTEELVDTLLRLGEGRSGVDPEAAGYMLRGYFVGVRRHIAFESEHLVNMAEEAVNSLR